MSGEKKDYAKESLLLSIKELEKELDDLASGKSSSDLGSDWGPGAYKLTKTLVRRKKQLNELETKSE